MEQSITHQPATDAGTPDTGTLLQPAEFRPADLPALLSVGKRFVAVCANGDLVPLSGEQFRDNWLGRGPNLNIQLNREDIVFVCSERCAQGWLTRESVIEFVAKHRAEEERPARLRQLRLELATIQPAAIRGDEATVTEWKELALKIARLESEIEREALKTSARNN